MEVSLASVEGPDGYRAIGILRDIRERKVAEQRLRLGASIISHAQQGILVTDARGRIDMVNPAFSRLTGYPAEEVLGKNPRILQSGRHDVGFYRALWEALEREGYWQGEIWNRRKDGEVYPEWLSLTAIRDADGRVTHYVGMFSDISRLKDAEEDLERLAFYDPLTAIPNRILFRERLQTAFKEARRQGGEGRIALLYLDLDYFKQVNDTHGHESGDQLLQQAAQRIVQQVREVDTVARLGGDEFAVVVKQIPDDTVARRIAGNIVQALTEPFQLEHCTCRIGTSLGIAIYPDHAATPEELIKLADAAMYEAKKEGRNRYFIQH